MSNKLTGSQVLSSSDSELISSSTITTTSQSAILAPQKNTLVCHLKVLGTVSGTSPSMTVKLQDSPDGVNWTDIPSAAFTAVTATGNLQRLVVQNVGAMVRAVATITGTTPSFGGVALTVQER